MEMQQFDDVLTNALLRAGNVLAARSGEPVDLARACVQEFLRRCQCRAKCNGPSTTARHRSRVLILVSKLDHCLEDLLYRHRTGELKMDLTGIVSNHRICSPLRTGMQFPTSDSDH